MSIGSNIRKLREGQGMTQADLGAIIGVSGKAVSTWENDIKTPRMGAIQAIADHFGVLITDVISEEISDKMINLRNDPLAEEFLGLYSALPPEKRRMAWAMMKGLVDNK